jgi:hypothetical protein
VNPIAPGVAERFDLLRFTGDMLTLSVGYFAAGRAPLEVAVELDAIGRVEIDALGL